MKNPCLETTRTILDILCSPANAIDFEGKAHKKDKYPIVKYGNDMREIICQLNWGITDPNVILKIWLDIAFSSRSVLMKLDRC